MSKVLNLELFNPGFIFNFKGNRHLVIKSYQAEVLVINLDWDDCELIHRIGKDSFSSVLLEDTIYYLSFENIELDAIGDNNTLILIEKEYD